MKQPLRQCSDELESFELLTRVLVDDFHEVYVTRADREWLVITDDVAKTELDRPEDEATPCTVYSFASKSDRISWLREAGWAAATDAAVSATTPQAVPVRRSAREGDIVQAIGLQRGRPQVTGRLELGLDGFGNVRVAVTARGQSYDVDPGSVVVIRPDADADEQSRSSDLDALRRTGRATAHRQFSAKSWDDLFEVLELAMQPLLDATWIVRDTLADHTLEIGDVACAELERGGLETFLEVDDEETLAIWPPRPIRRPKTLDDPPDDEAYPELALIPDVNDTDLLLALYEQQKVLP